jgi:hypothetical protein
MKEIKEKLIHVNQIKIIIIRLFNSKTIKLYFFNKIIGSYIIVKKIIANISIKCLISFKKYNIMR